MAVIINNLNTPVPKIFLPFCQNETAKNPKRTFRYHNKTESDTFTKRNALIGAVSGSFLAVSTMAIRQQVKPWKIEYGLKEIIGLAASSIIGGVAVGSIKASKEDKKEKRVEGLFQFLNTAFPASLVTAGIYAATKSTNYNTPTVKIAASILGLLIGMQLASNVTNIISDPHNKVPDRKLGFKDALANIDDALGVFVLMKPKKTAKNASTILNQINIEPALPVVAAWCGYRAGQTN